MPIPVQPRPTAGTEHADASSFAVPLLTMATGPAIAAAHLQPPAYSSSPLL
uniref:Uncharacterized protein n=1 Tax=Arundo donax TaxID=35708 RepID=A0A0A9BS35_ARUDO